MYCSAYFDLFYSQIFFPYQNVFFFIFILVIVLWKTPQALVESSLLCFRSQAKLYFEDTKHKENETAWAQTHTPPYQTLPRAAGPHFLCLLPSCQPPRPWNKCRHSLCGTVGNVSFRSNLVSPVDGEQLHFNMTVRPFWFVVLYNMIGIYLFF